MPTDLKQLIHLDEQDGFDGFSHTVRVGPFIQVGETLPLQADGRSAFPDDVYWQTILAIETATTAFLAAGGLLDHITKVRISFVEREDFSGIFRAFQEKFSAIKPSYSSYHVMSLACPEAKVSIELEGVAVNYHPPSEPTS
jgi:enamine deaminase RidA (YjgF/YER057c/UK114 family)